MKKKKRKIDFHNFSTENSKPEAELAALGKSFIPTNTSKDWYNKMITQSWKEFKQQLKSSSKCEKEALNEYFAKTEHALQTFLTKLPSKEGKGNLSKRLKKQLLKSQKDDYHVFGITDKNLGVAKIEAKRFEELQKQQICAEKGWQKVDKPLVEVMKDAHKRVFAWMTKFVWGTKVTISDLTEKWKKFSNNSSEPAVFHGILKVHKDKLAVRPVVRALQWIVFNFSKHLVPIMTNLLNKIIAHSNATHILENSDKLLNELDKFRPSSKKDDYFMLSTDVSEMYPSIKRCWINKELKYWMSCLHLTKLQQEKILEGLEIIQQCNFALFEGQLYQATEGLNTGDPISPIIATIVPLRKELEALKKWPIRYWRYLDDTLQIVNLKDKEKVKHFASEMWKNFKITFEEEKHGEINFLDVTVMKAENWYARRAKSEYFRQLDTKVYQKPQNLYQYLHFQSNHQKHIFSGLIFGEICRYIKICSRLSDFLAIKTQFIERLKNRGYPLQFIRDSLRKCPKWEERDSIRKKRESKIPSQTQDLQESQDNEQPKLLFFKKTFEKTRNHDNTLRKIITFAWDSLPDDLQNVNLRFVNRVQPNLYKTLLCWPKSVKDKLEHVDFHLSFKEIIPLVSEIKESKKRKISNLETIKFPNKKRLKQTKLTTIISKDNTTK